MLVCTFDTPYVHWNVHFILISEIKQTNNQYERLLQEKQRSDKPMFSLAWDMNEQIRVQDDCRQLLVEMDVLLKLAWLV